VARVAPDVSQAAGNLTPAEANRRFYAENAELYDSTEACANSDHARRRLASALEHALVHLPGDARVLDAGGGSGNASLILAERGFDPLLVDVSPEMVSIWEAKADRLGISPRSQVSTLEEFFQADERQWDLIVFSSVLHHLYDPEALLRMAAARVAPGGFIVTIFDPLELSGVGQVLRRLDYVTWLLLKSPGHLVRRIVARLRGGDEEASEQSTGELAEYHAVTGLDDGALVRVLADSGMEIVAHERLSDARFGFIRVLARLAGIATAFSLVARLAPAGR
jgi:2-polyprenyl-3-methyl-5-hydroxy-6-metoxy-1,4-benzoquinol methylase